MKSLTKADILNLDKVMIDTMEHSGYKAKIMKAMRLTGEELHRLPPGNAISVIPIHCLPGCPDAWVREAGSYVCPVSCDIGLWFDWTDNDVNTAIIPSVKGMNPVTGEQIKELKMEQYRDKCPKHNIALAHDRYCEKCGYSLPPQNYVSVCDGNQRLWWDGFRQPDGSVRQFFFTEDDKRDIASLVIGKENTVPAFGFAFFKTKVNRVVEQRYVRGMNANWNTGNNNIMLMSSNYTSLTNDSISCISESGMSGTSGTSGAINFIGANSTKKHSEAMLDGINDICGSLSRKSKNVSTPVDYSCNNIKSISGDECRSKKSSRVPNKDVSVGAGARINQNLDVDKLALSEYIETPQSLIRLYFQVFFFKHQKFCLKHGPF